VDVIEEELPLQAYSRITCQCRRQHNKPPTSTVPTWATYINGKHKNANSVHL